MAKRSASEAFRPTREILDKVDRLLDTIVPEDDVDDSSEDDNPSSDPFDDEEQARWNTQIGRLKKLTRNAMLFKDAPKATRTRSKHLTSAQHESRYVEAATLSDLVAIAGVEPLRPKEILDMFVRTQERSHVRGYFYSSRGNALRATVRGISSASKHEWSDVVKHKLLGSERFDAFLTQLEVVRRRSSNNIGVLIKSYDTIQSIRDDSKTTAEYARQVLEKTLTCLWMKGWEVVDADDEAVKKYQSQHGDRLTGERRLLQLVFQYGPAVILISDWRIDLLRNKEHSAPSDRANQLLYNAFQQPQDNEPPVIHTLKRNSTKAQTTLNSFLVYQWGDLGKRIRNDLEERIWKDPRSLNAS